MNTKKVISSEKKDVFVCTITTILSILIWIPTYFCDEINQVYIMPIPCIWLLCLLVCSRKAKNFPSYLLSFVAIWISTTFVAYGLYGTGITELIPNLISSVILFSAFLVDNWLNRKYNNFALTLVFPLLYTLLTILTSLLRIGVNLRLDAYLSSLLVPYQVVSIIGAYGLSFLVAWILTCILYVVKNRKDHNKLKVAIICPIVIIAIVAFGFIRLNTAPQADLTFKAAYAVGPYRGSFIDYEEQSYDEKVEYLTSTCQSSTKEGATFVAFTEEAFCLDEEESKNFITLAKEEAIKNNIAILLGLEIEYDEFSKNEIVWIDSTGEIKTEYLKSHLIPILEKPYYESWK